MFRWNRPQILPIGVDIGHDSVKMLQLEVRGEKLVVHASARRMLEATGSDGAPSNSAELISPQAGQAIRQLSRATAPTELSVTASIGVATSTQQGSTTDEVVQAADKALYRAKAAGRNRIETASSARRRTRSKAAGIA